MSLSVESPPAYRHVLDVLAGELTDAGVDAPRRTAEWMLMDVVDASRAELYAHDDRTVDRDDLAVLERMIERRSRSEPLQYILGHTEFYGLRIEVSPAVLIPRPETERVVEILLERLEAFAGPTVLDIGTGSGCIAFAVARARSNARVFGCDNSKAALEVARRNARNLELGVEFRRADVAGELFMPGGGGSFDAVVSNPPYVSPAERASLAPEVRAYEPEEALFTPADPLHFYRIIAEKSMRLLRGGGWLVFETHAEYGSAVADLLRRRGYESVELHEDWADRPRVALGRKGARPDG